MIQIRLSADSREELKAARLTIHGQFAIYRLKESKEPTGGRYRAYLLATVNNGGSPNEQRKP